MDVQLFLAVNIMAMAAIAIVAILIHSRAATAWPWIAVNGIVVAVGLACLQWWPGWAGVITASLYVPFVLAPMLLNARAQRALLKSNTKEAARYLKAAALLHPTPTMRFSAAMTDAQAHDGEDARISALESLAQTATAEQKAVIRAVVLRARDDWEGILRAARQRPAGAGSSASFDTSALEIRALGETGRIDEMVRRFDEATPKLHAGDQAQCQMLVLAFCGKPNELRRLFEQPLAGLDHEAKAYWIAIAERAAGSADETWKAPLRILADTSNKPDMRRRAERQLKLAASGGSFDDHEPLSGTANAVLGRLTARLQTPPASASGSAPAAAAQPQRGGIFATPVTYSLLALILAGYGLEEANGGGENLRALAELGAMWPPYVVGRGEWWRLGSSLFLHYGLLHLGMNSLMLYMLGRGTELAIGWWRTLLIYSVGGLCSSAFVLWLMTSGYTNQAVLMGASGAIMALFGALLTRQVATWLRTRDIQDRREITMLAVVVAIQVAIDLSLPQISFAAHASGFITGLLVGLALEATGNDRRRLG